LSKTRIRTFHNQAYGLQIVADMSIPELATLKPSSHRNAVRVSLARRFERSYLIPRWYLQSRQPRGKPWLRYGKIQDGYVLSFPDLADFVVDGVGSRIVCCNASGDATIRTIRHLLIDQVLPLIVNLRGKEALHATAIATRKGICAFTGPAGSGKSTLAASFVMSGYPLVCDDCLAVTERKTIVALPGYPGLRLWDDSIQGVGATSRNLKPVAHYTGKSRWSTYSRPTEFYTKPRRLARVYLLKRSRSSRPSTRVVIRELAPAEALMGLVKAAYRFDITDTAMLKRQFHFLARVAEQVPIKQLVMPNDFSALADVKQAVLRDSSE
jgi:hypothetical protein